MSPAVGSRALRLAVCVPRACSVDAMLRRYVEHPLVRFNYSLDSCRLPRDMPYVGSDYVVLSILALLGLLTFVGTAYELSYIFIRNKEPAAGNQVLQAWSVYGNTHRLLTFGESSGTLGFLDGIRALSVLWIIALHSAVKMLPNSTNEVEIVHSAIPRQKYLWAFTGHLAVDSFFALSGLLLVYSTVNKSKSIRLRDLPLFYLNRYMRLLPALVVAVLLQAGVMHRLVDGPRQKDNMEGVEGCRTYWWTALLHVQNFVNYEKMCLLHIWYLSVDMQLYLVSPLVLCWVVRGRRAAWCALAAALLASLTASLAFCFYFNFAHKWNQSDIVPFGFWQWYYINPFTRSPPFFVGMLFGYILHVCKNEKLHLSKFNVFLFYALALASISFAVLQEHPGTDIFWANHQVAVNIKYAVYRSCWALAICWLILACAHGYGGPVNWFLSLKLWQFVARISYPMYLFSYLIQQTNVTIAAEIYFDTQSLLWRYAGDLLVTVALAMATCVVVEAPVAALYKLMVKKITARNNDKLTV